MIMEEISIERIEEEKVSKLKSQMKNLYNIWNIIGLNSEKKNERCKLAWEHIISLSEDILKEENDIYNSLLVRVQEFSKEISELSNQLLIPCAEEAEGTLLVKEEMLRKKFSNLRKIKEERMKKYHDLRNMELKYCKILGWLALEISSKTGVPSEHDISELEQNITVMQKEKDDRIRRFCTARRELTTILEKTEIQPETSFEKQILSSHEDTISLTNKTFETLKQMVQKVKTKKADLEYEKGTLVTKLGVLWDRLGIPEAEREDFLSQHADYKVSTIKLIRDEVEKYEEMKRENLKKYICNMREELQSLWNNCFASKEEKENFPFFKSEDYTEDNLQAHEVEVDKWRILLAKIEHIGKKIEKRNKLWDLLIVFENKAGDPNRFTNRRGNLLKEEKERKKLGDDLPALENEIFLDIENYEDENGIAFLYFGENYRAAVIKQWEERKIQKENEKIMRHKKRMLQVENEVTSGTPSVKRTLCCTPRSAPSKLLKSLGVPVYRTPLGRTNKNSPRTVGKQGIHPKLSSVRKGMDQVVPLKAVLKQNSPIGVASSSKDDTTYSAFSNTVNKPARRLLRSSVLSTRKVVGTRISIGSKNKRKSTKKSVRRSTRNKSDVTSKLAPARGNPGLPFLI